MSSFSIILYRLTWWISRIQYGDSFTLEPLLTTCQLWIWCQTLANEKTCYVRKVWRYQREVIRSRKSKDRQHNAQKKNDKETNNDLQNITTKTKDRATWSPLKTGGELRCSGRLSSSCSTSGTRPLTFVTNPVISSNCIRITSHIQIFMSIFRSQLQTCCKCWSRPNTDITNRYC